MLQQKALNALQEISSSNTVSILSERTMVSNDHKTEIKLKSLILAQIERWRHALHMQVERQHGACSGGEWRTGE